MVSLKLLCAAAAVAVVSADGCDRSERSEHLTKSGYTSYDTDFTGNPKGKKFSEVDLTAAAKKSRGVHIFEYNDPHDDEDVPETIIKFMKDRLNGNGGFATIWDDFTRTFLKGWHRNTFSIKTGNDKYAYIEVSAEETPTTWTWARDNFATPATWMVGSVAENAGISTDLVDLLCESAVDTIFTDFQDYIPSLPGAADNNQLSFSAVGNTRIMAIRCSRTNERVAPTCASEDEITVDGPSLDWAQIGYFFLGVFLIVQALELSKEALVWYGGISTLFFVVIAYWILMWVKNQGNVAKYVGAPRGSLHG